MTGYAVVARELPQGSLNLELRSVNNRYLDIQFRLPDEFRLLEVTMREFLTARLNRGKIECRVSFSGIASTEDLQHINADLLQKLLALNRTVRAALPDAHGLEVADILRWPGMLRANSLPAESLREPCLELLAVALHELAAARAREGEKLKVVLLERLSRMRSLAAEVAPRIPALLVAFQEKIKARLHDAMINCDDERIRQELTLFAGKIDVDEELSRLQAHFEEVERVLRKGGAVGKRLDFLMQELNREANTVGSKSVDAEVSKISIELKVLIEQMREQVQNLE
ncbi:YicC/YloC family endoribonuclease [Nitrosospira briensis]|uniref:YicC/YloC family endoribonuclease n=1 Tax=Nitrosospira briensis TaxID=35799 RepID=UPI00055AB7CF|nr:YicC/YloC family endoribonuclease [Nitrosospira briensis]